MTTSKPLTVEKSHIDRIIDKDLRLTHLIYTCAVATACCLMIGSLVWESISAFA